MIDAIIRNSLASSYDFRDRANPNDALAHLFEQWVGHYKLKWATSHSLKPDTILEIGVGFGYSAAAFLHGYSQAHYIGIDLDSDKYGDIKGALKWAKRITRQFTADFIIADTQPMDRCPGGVYDLIHVAGRRDQDGSFHDLELAIRQGRYILVDRYLSTPTHFAAINEFIFRYRDLFEFYGVISGDLLIKVSEVGLSDSQVVGNSSSDIRQAYTSDYYFQDCGGFDSYRKSKGKELQDLRLQAVATIASLKQQGRALDLGCGRGELTYHLAKRGFKVTAVDYSENAIELARECFEEEENLKARVEFYPEPISTVPLRERYDLAIASDLIEHLSIDEVDLLYERISRHLKPDGLFVLHTFPNLWYYRYEYPRRRRIASSVGAYLPAQPRTRYEMVMHINEQSPRVLRNQLRRYFEHVLLWFGDPSSPGGSLLEKFGKRQMCAAQDIFAIASHLPINEKELKARLRMEVLPPLASGELKLLVKECPLNVAADSVFDAGVEIVNFSSYVITSNPPYPVHIACHWIDENSSAVILFDGQRSRLTSPLAQGIKELYKARFKAPRERGNYILRVTLVQEAVRWFDQAPTLLADDIPIMVS